MRIPTQRARAVLAATVAGAVVAGLSATVVAHGVTSSDARFLESLRGAAVLPLMYLGAKHMVTGYDHLLFLAGVVFFLSRPKDILLYVSVFTAGHSATLLAGALGGLQTNAALVDAVIGLSVVYKGFENLGGWRRLLGFDPNPRWAVGIFGLFHGLGLATKLQGLALARQGLVINIISFNVGVEIGQMLALGAVLIALMWWRRHPHYLHHAVVANTALMTGGFTLAGVHAAELLVGR